MLKEVKNSKVAPGIPFAPSQFAKQNQDDVRGSDALRENKHRAGAVPQNACCMCLIRKATSLTREMGCKGDRNDA